MNAELRARLEALRPGDWVELTETNGARVSGVVVSRRPGIDEDDEVRVRRLGGSMAYVPYDRIAGLA